MAAIKGAKIFTKLDCTNAFHTLPVARDDRHKTAFTWNGTVYQFKRAPFGLKQIPSKYQRVMEILFAAKRMYIICYIDDIVVFSMELGQHHTHVNEAIETLTVQGFKLNLKKCKFAQIRIPFLGHIVDADGVRVNPNKLDGCEEWHIPTTGTDLLHFLGMVNYWRDNIPLLGVRNGTSGVYSGSREEISGN